MMYGRSPFPTRTDAPTSGVVQSNDEFNQDWQTKIGALAAEATTQWNEQDALMKGSASLNKWSGGNSNGWVDPDLARRYAADPTAWSAAPEAYSPATYAALEEYRRSVPFGGVGNREFDPWAAQQALEQTQREFASAGAQRTENQTRQQQAFDTGMMANGAVGGVIPSDYSSPTYGQITGRQGGLGGLGGMPGNDLSGVDFAQQSGAYMGGAGAYNPSPWSTSSFNGQKPWGGF